MNKDEEERKNAASGGIATAIYKYALENGWYIVWSFNEYRFSCFIEGDK